MFGALWLWVVPLSGQTVSLDTAGAQYRAQPRLIDSLAQRTLVWARRLRLFDWRITVRADSLTDALAQLRALAAFSLECVTAELAGKYPASLGIAGGAWLYGPAGDACGACLGRGCVDCASSGFELDPDLVGAVA